VMYERKRQWNLTALFQQVETGILADFQEAAFVGHAGDKGENREEILRQFLAERLPRALRGNQRRDSHKGRKA